MPLKMDNQERKACVPEPINAGGFNSKAVLPLGLNITHIGNAMADFLEFLQLINKQLATKQLPRLESILMPANFSSIVGEFMAAGIPKYCKTLVKNRFHNGHPDLIPAGKFSGNAVQYCEEGIEIKGSLYLRGWQGHNPENCWLMVFVFDSNRPVDSAPEKLVPPKPFRFLSVFGAQLKMEDWSFSGRSASSRRTITASVTDTGFQKMTANWIYKSPKTDN